MVNIKPQSEIDVVIIMSQWQKHLPTKCGYKSATVTLTTTSVKGNQQKQQQMVLTSAIK